ncbi:MAG: GFA family protein [Gammaproteobacteria bacterium]|nr:GFA family protein [Gammaproteobacteria bacterium]
MNYEITGSIRSAGHCHCSICRKSHGAAFATWAQIDPDQFRWSSGPDLVECYQSSPGHHRCFCKRCGSPLVATQGGKVSEVVLATIDGDPQVRPEAHIFVGSKAPWYEIADPLPRFERWPPGLES